LVKHAKNLQHLAIGPWEHLDFHQVVGTELIAQEYEPQELALFDAEEPARVLSSQLEWLGRMAVHTQMQEGELGTVEKLKAASSQPKFKVTLVPPLLVSAAVEEGGAEGEEEGEEGEEEEDEEDEEDEEEEG
jgi:hypothetical protein